MDHVVITGGTRGIGRALAHEFLLRGCRVSVSGRNQVPVDSTVRELIRSTGNGACHGFSCDVTGWEMLRRLWDQASAFQEISIWINNAGINHINHHFHELDAELIGRVVDTNITGTMLASKVALEGMIGQGYGSIYNMEGFGSNGRVMAGMSVYGTSKNAIRYFSRSLIREHAHDGIVIGTISPGMVVTDMLLEPLRLEPERNKHALRIFHTLADPADRVAPWLATRILNNRKNGRNIAWLTPGKITWRFFSGMFKKRKVKGLPQFEL